MDSYFGKKDTGGSYASRGFEYQDSCCLSSLFENIKEEDFKCISVETINDFTVIFETHEKSVQVKKRSIDLKFAKSLLENIKLDNNIKYEFIGTNVSEEVINIMCKAEWLKNVLESPKSESEKLRIKNNFIDELEKLKIDNLYEKILCSKFTSRAEDVVNLCFRAYYSEWITMNKLSINADELFKSLLLKISEMRSRREFLMKKDVIDLAQKYAIENPIDQVVSKLYTQYFKGCPEILKILGKDKDDIINVLELNIKKADSHIKNKEFEQALNIYESLGKLYEKEPILINCARLSEITQKYEELKQYCERILKLNPKNFEAYLMLGTTYSESGDNDKALEYLFCAQEIKKTSIGYYNIGYIYQMKKDNANAYENYSECLKLDENFIDAHFNISMVVYDRFEKIYHLDKVIELDESEYIAYLEKGKILRDIGLYELAIKYFEKYLRYDKNNSEALREISLSMFDLGKCDEAITYLSSWIKEEKNTLLSNKIENGKFGVIMDINWHRTKVIPYKKVDDNTIIILNQYCGDIKINLLEDEGMIFIGCMIRKDATNFPIIGKRYKYLNGYNNIKKYIDDSCDLKKVVESIYEDVDTRIEVIIKEKRDYIYI